MVIQRQAGVTLIELIISIVVITVAVVGVLAAMNTAVRHSADPMLQTQANAIAQSYLEEIMLRAFCDPDLDLDPDQNCDVGNLPGTADCMVCLEPVEPDGRAVYDNVCDYHNLNDAGAVDQNGADIVGLEGYSVRVTVATDDTLNGLQGASCEVLRVDVQVTHSAGVDTTVSAYRANY